MDLRTLEKENPVAKEDFTPGGKVKAAAKASKESSLRDELRFRQKHHGGQRHTTRSNHGGRPRITRNGMVPMTIGNLPPTMEAGGIVIVGLRITTMT